MNIIASTSFVSISASGESWRDIVRKALEEYESFKTDGFKPDIGFLYLTEALADDAQSILTLLKSVTGVQNWSGCVAAGVCGCGVEYVGVPAMSLLIGAVGEGRFQPFTAEADTLKRLRDDLKPWLDNNAPMLVTAHAAPQAMMHGTDFLEDIGNMLEGFVVGGLASFQAEAPLLSPEAAIEGFVFNADVAVATALSQGCVPIGLPHEITQVQDDHVIAALDGRDPTEVFTHDLANAASTRQAQANDTQNAQGVAHIGFPVQGSDLGDYLVRNILAIDPSNGLMAVGENVEVGQKVVFMHRDTQSVKTDLTRMLVGLHKRVSAEHGIFKPKAALYVSCVARADMAFGSDGQAGGEMALIRDVLGDIPLAGFYASGEISNARLYGQTGVLTLFL